MTNYSGKQFGSSTPSISPREMTSHVHTGTLFLIPKWKQPKYALTYKWIAKYDVNYGNKKNTTVMSPENNMLKETNKMTYCLYKRFRIGKSIVMESM